MNAVNTGVAAAVQSGKHTRGYACTRARTRLPTRSSTGTTFMMPLAIHRYTSSPVASTMVATAGPALTIGSSL